MRHQQKAQFQQQWHLTPAQSLQQSAPFGSVVRLAGLQREGYGRARVRRSEMDLGVPPASGFADILRTVFLGAPVPSGCTFTWYCPATRLRS